MLAAAVTLGRSHERAVLEHAKVRSNGTKALTMRGLARETKLDVSDMRMEHGALENGTRSPRLGDLGHALTITGKRDEAEALRADLMTRRTRGRYPAFPIGRSSLAWAIPTRPWVWLEHAVEERSLSFYLPSIDPSYDAVRSHPRFRAALTAMNLDTVSP
jgi:hypothetical protein